MIKNKSTDHGQFSNTAKNVTLAVVALNEEILIKSTVNSIVENASKYLSDYEIILLNDGSKDKTGLYMDELASQNNKIKVIHNPGNIGLGGSLKRALQDASLEHFMLLCGDGGLPGESLPAIFEKIGQADLIIPYMANLKKIKSSERYFLSRTYTTLLNIIFRQKLNYYNGLPVYKTNLLKQLKITSSGFGFQAEIVTKLLKTGCSYLEVKVNGAEKSNRSTAVSLPNFIGVAKTLFNLIWEVFIFNPSSVKKL